MADQYSSGVNGVFLVLTKQRIVPTAAGSATINGSTSVLVMVPAGTIASFTLTMPSPAIDGQTIDMCSSQIITSLTLSGGAGQSVVGALTSLAVGGSASYIYVAADATWYKIG